MSVYKIKTFARFARGEGIGDRNLLEAVERADNGLIDADLGGSLIKQRVARKGAGRSGGYRVLIAYRTEAFFVFLYGFAKKDRDNLDAQELKSCGAWPKPGSRPTRRRSSEPWNRDN